MAGSDDAGISGIGRESHPMAFSRVELVNMGEVTEKGTDSSG